MRATADIVRAQRLRQLAHWRLAVERLGDLDLLAPPGGWQALEHYVDVALRHSLAASVARLRARVDRLESALVAARGDDLGGQLDGLRAAFVRAETTLDFYADALASRANPPMARLLRACDYIAQRGMAEILTPLGRQVPAVLTFLDKGLGASILKAGLRLWDPELENPVAAIKVVRHNLLRPTAILHECGHQVAHALGWNPELARALAVAASAHSAELGGLWAGWASEIAGDCVAFVHVGYAAVASLHDVVAGGDGAVFQWLPDDPHPIAFLRVLLGVAMCRHVYGPGPWDDLATCWLAEHPLERAGASVRPLLAASVALLPRLVEVCLDAPYAAFAGRRLRDCVDPLRVSPGALGELAQAAGKAALTSSYWLWNEAIRLLAMTGYRAGLGAGDVRDGLTAQRALMERLGEVRGDDKRRG